VFDVGLLKQISVKQGLVIAFYQLWFAFAFLLSCLPLLGPILGDLLLAIFFYTQADTPIPPAIFAPSSPPHARFPIHPRQAHQPLVWPLPLREKNWSRCRRQTRQQGTVPPDCYSFSPHLATQVNSRMCYMYFRMWLSFLLRDGAPSPRFPGQPTLFLYGAKKRIMFHDQRHAPPPALKHAAPQAFLSGLSTSWPPHRAAAAGPSTTVSSVS
jgi:hypothetical protein